MAATGSPPRERGCEVPLLERYRHSSHPSAPELSRNSRDRGERRQLAAEHVGIVARDSARPGTVLGGDETGERPAVVERGDGSETAAADDGYATTLRFDA